MSPAEERKKKPAVLVADDSDISRTFIRMLLRKEYEVVEATTGQEVIDLLQRGEVDYQLLLLDLHMPVVDGWGVLNFLREMDLLSVLPVIIVSAMAVEPDTLVKCYEGGAWMVVTKPFTEKVLLAQIGSFVARIEGVKRAALKTRLTGGDSSGMRLIADASTNAIFAEDPNSHIITYGNARFIALTGGKPVEGRYLADVVGAAVAPVFMAASRSLLSEHVVVPVTVSFAPQEYHSLAYTAIEDAAKQPVSLIGTITNLTGLVRRVKDLERVKFERRVR